MMAERLVDVLNSDDAVLHTFPITIDGSRGSHEEADYRQKASEAAAHAQLVPHAELQTLTTRMHVGRGGALAPYGDTEHPLSQTREGLEQIVRESAYFLWQQEGSPNGRADEYWNRAHEQHLRQRAYVLWEQEGCEEG